MTVLPWRFRRGRVSLLRWQTVLSIKMERPQLVYSRSPLLALTTVRQHADTVLELHALPEENSFTADLLARLMREPNLLRIVCISQALADDLIHFYKGTNGHGDIIVAHDGAVARREHRPSAAAGEPFRVGYFGHLYPGKGMELIANVAPRLSQMQFDVYGGTDEAIAYWQSKVRSVPNIHLHGHIPHALVANKMEECDVLIAPYGATVSSSGGGEIGRWMSPLKVFEYMAVGRPIVVADLPVLREVLRDGITAIFCGVSAVDQWVSALNALHASSEFRSRLGNAARQELESRFTWDKRAARVVQNLAVGNMKYARK